MLKTLYCGQKPLGEMCFNFLLEQTKLEVVGVVSNERQRGWWKSSALAEKAKALGLPFLANDKKNDAGVLNFAKQLDAECLLSVQHPWILSSEILDVVGGCAFNLHLAPLPAYKGWNGCSHALLNRDKNFGTTLHWISTELDCGDIAYDILFPIEGDDNASTVYHKAERSGVELFKVLINDLAAGRVPPRQPMQGSGRLYQRGDLDAFREVDPYLGVDEMAHRARAFHFPPYEPAYIWSGGSKIFLIPENAGAS